MKKVYLEHSYLAKEDNWPSIIEFFREDGYTAVVSDWNIVEISQASDRKQAKRRVRFLESLNPLWMINKVEIQKKEVQSFLFRSYFGEFIWPYNVFVESFFTSVEVSLSRKPKQGWSLFKFVDACLKDPSILHPIKKEQDVYLEDYFRIKGIGIDKIKNMHDEILRRWIIDVLPNKQPNGKNLNLEEKNFLLEYCVQNKQKFFNYCPYFAFENALFYQRYADANRQPRKSDALDLEHICCSVSYCDSVVAEKYLKHIANITNKNNTFGKVVSSVSEI